MSCRGLTSMERGWKSPSRSSTSALAVTIATNGSSLFPLFAIVPLLIAPADDTNKSSAPRAVRLQYNHPNARTSTRVSQALTCTPEELPDENVKIAMDRAALWCVLYG